MKLIVTQEMLDEKPELIEQGYKVGDEIEVAENDVTSDNESPQPNESNLDGDPPVGGNHPIPRPRKP